MTREELAHIVRAAARISQSDQMLIIGSQSILGSYAESELPDLTTLSREADVAFWDDDDETLADRVDLYIGELSQFDEAFGVYAQGVSVSTAVLPAGWRERLVPFREPGTRGATAWCLEPHDLAISKLVAHRLKDYEFVTALVGAGMMDVALLRQRALTLPLPPIEIAAVTRWLSSAR